MKAMKIVTLAAGLLAMGAPLAIGVYPLTALAQTKGMEHRDDRRDTRQGSRQEKQVCKHGTGKSNTECRQEKRDTKQEGRHNGV